MRKHYAFKWPIPGALHILSCAEARMSLCGTVIQSGERYADVERGKICKRCRLIEKTPSNRRLSQRMGGKLAVKNPLVLFVPSEPPGDGPEPSEGTEKNER